MPCKGLCESIREPRPPSTYYKSRYGDGGQRFCSVCSHYFVTNKRRCPCCHTPLRGRALAKNTIERERKIREEEKKELLVVTTTTTRNPKKNVRRGNNGGGGRTTTYTYEERQTEFKNEYEQEIQSGCLLCSVSKLVCFHCKTVFYAKCVGGSRRKYCSTRCSKNARVVLAKARREEARNKVCLLCKTPFKSKRKDAKYCSMNCRVKDYPRTDIIYKFKY